MTKLIKNIENCELIEFNEKETKLQINKQINLILTIENEFYKI